jgi:hypothetical protein
LPTCGGSSPRGNGCPLFHLSEMDLWREELKADLARDGLGGSVAIYAGALLGALALIAGPVYVAVAPQVYENPPPEPLDPLLKGPIVGSRVSTPMPLAQLKHQIIVDPKLVAELNARARKQPEPARRQTVQQTVHGASVRERGHTVAELPERRERTGFFLFNLFGG